MMEVNTAALLAQARQMQQLCRALCQEAEELRVTGGRLQENRSFSQLGRQVKRQAQDVEEEAMELWQLGQALSRTAELVGRTEERLIQAAEGSFAGARPPSPREVRIQEEDPLLSFCE